MQTMARTSIALGTLGILAAAAPATAQVDLSQPGGRQIVSGVAKLVSNLLKTCPNLSFLATSREPL